MELQGVKPTHLVPALEHVLPPPLAMSSYGNKKHELKPSASEFNFVGGFDEPVLQVAVGWVDVGEVRPRNFKSVLGQNNLTFGRYEATNTAARVEGDTFGPELG